MRTALFGAVAVVVAVPTTAHAGRSFFGWTTDTQVLPERGAEVESWLEAQNGLEPVNAHWTTWGFSALIGVTDQLELGFPLEMRWSRNDTGAEAFDLQQYGLEARYRMVTSDAEDAPPFAPLVRVAVKRDIDVRDAIVAEGNLVLTTTTESGGVAAAADLGYVGFFSQDTTNHQELRPAAGVSFKVKGDLRLGAEVFAQLSLDDKRKGWAAAGPNISWTQGRFWVSGAFGIGFYQIDTAPKVTWGIMF
ncbi:hypothetical protein BH11MYX2_BH11MYX2_35210 [soil metagenome]